VLELESDLHIPASDDHQASGQEVPIVEQLQEELDRCIASECLYCGDVMIKAVELPFVDEKELMGEALSWAL
jgi:hypothetical protein